VEAEARLAWPDYPEGRDNFEASERAPLSPEAYDRRIQVYRIAREFLGGVFAEVNVSVERLQQFTWDTDEAIFLFDKDLAD
jgi:hypothetical protein